jgi:hypothetical protein
LRPSEDAPPNLGVVVGGTHAGIVRKHQLLDHGVEVLSSASDGRLLVAIVRWLDSLARRCAPTDLLPITARAFVERSEPSRVLVVDERLHPQMARQMSAIRHLDLVEIDANPLWIDPVTAEVVFDLDRIEPRTTTRQLAAIGRPDRHALLEPAGRLPLDRLIVAGGITGPVEHPLASALGLLLPPPRQPIRPGDAPRWAEVLQRLDVRCIDWVHGDLLAELS